VADEEAEVEAGEGEEEDLDLGLEDVDLHLMQATHPVVTQVLIEDWDQRLRALSYRLRALSICLLRKREPGPSHPTREGGK